MTKNNNMNTHFCNANYLHYIMMSFLLLFDKVYANTCSDIIRKDTEWNAGIKFLKMLIDVFNYMINETECFVGQTGIIFLKFQHSVSSWHVKVTFTSAFTDFTVYNSDKLQCSNLSCEFDNSDWNGDISAGQILELTYKLEFSSPSDINEIILQDVILCGDEFVTLAPSPNGTTFDCLRFWCFQAGTSEQYTRCDGGWQLVRPK